MVGHVHYVELEGRDVREIAGIDDDDIEVPDAAVRIYYYSPGYGEYPEIMSVHVEDYPLALSEKQLAALEESAVRMFYRECPWQEWREVSWDDYLED